MNIRFGQMSFIRTVNLMFTVGVAVGHIVACSGGTQIASPTVESLSGSDAKKKKKKDTSSSLDDGDADNVFKDYGKSTDPAAAVEEVKEFPKFKFLGNGQTSNDGKGYATTSLIVSELKTDTFMLDQQDANVTVPSKQDQATADIREKAVGKTVYKRSTIEERKNIVDASGKSNSAPYVIFASGVTDVKGNQFTFSSPLPVFPFPGVKARYAEVIAASAGWKATVTGGGQTFDVTMTVSAVDVADDVVRLIITTEIPSDTDGRLYEIFPPAKRGEYTLVTTSKRVTGMRMSYWFFADASSYSSKRKETVEMTYSLCTVTKDGTTEQITSCP
jgi:hypothetical protein